MHYYWLIFLLAQKKKTLDEYNIILFIYLFIHLMEINVTVVLGV